MVKCSKMPWSPLSHPRIIVCSWKTSCSYSFVYLSMPCRDMAASRLHFRGQCLFSAVASQRQVAQSQRLIFSRWVMLVTACWEWSSTKCLTQYLDRQLSTQRVISQISIACCQTLAQISSKICCGLTGMDYWCRLAQISSMLKLVLAWLVLMY